MIGIITFHRAVNYGAVLQCFALQQALDNIGAENEVIDYRCEFIEKHYSYVPTVSIVHIKQFIKECFQFPTKYKARKKFDRFLENNIRLSSEYIIAKDISKHKQTYNTIITGSDQVWNLAISGEDTAYLLDFAGNDVKKISYAASLGPIDIEAKYLNQIKKYINRFDVVSLREPAAVDTIRCIYNKNIEVDVDPTVLLDSKTWDILVSKSNLKVDKFIFVYLMQDSEILREKAMQIAEEKDLKILYIGMVNNINIKGKNMKGASVEDFLWMIKNAEYVVTNSFHGIMFSLFFEKIFYWAYQKGKNMSNPRFEMLYQYYGIEKCCCNKNKLENLDYEYIKQKMDEQRQVSIDNLKRYILEC